MNALELCNACDSEQAVTPAGYCAGCDPVEAPSWDTRHLDVPADYDKENPMPTTNPTYTTMDPRWSVLAVNPDGSSWPVRAFQFDMPVPGWITDAAEVVRYHTGITPALVESGGEAVLWVDSHQYPVVLGYLGASWQVHLLAWAGHGETDADVLAAIRHGDLDGIGRLLGALRR